MEELVQIQSDLKVPKSQFNKFGNYHYRNSEDILEALKPLLKLRSCSLLINDEVVLIGERYYIKATVELTNSAGESVKATGYAREALNKKGMDESQITGSTSSYARKYALNGLFAIDDNKDADSFDNRPKQEEKQQAPKQQANSSGSAYIRTFGQLVGKLTNGGKKEQVQPLFAEISQTFNVPFQSSADFKKLDQAYQTQINQFLQQKLGD
ncbi:ERF family protein [Weissella viridescens]|uniref:ERF family protein n=1 Tax=Weissella viridescens TaxID=1629 RepID=UPI003AA89441